MYLIPFESDFPDVAEDETRMLQFPTEAGDVETFALVEMYCDDPHCDCRKVSLNVVRTGDEEHVATIGHFFDPIGKDDRRRQMGIVEQTYLDPISPQSELSNEILDLVKQMIGVGDYAEDLERHYEMIKQINRSEQTVRPGQSIELTQDEEEAAKKKLIKRKRSVRGSTKKKLQKAVKLRRYKADQILVNQGWGETELANLAQVIKQPNQRYALTSLLIDLGCLGPKQGFLETDMSREQVDTYLSRFEDMVDCDPNLAAKISERGALLGTHLDFEIPDECLAPMALFERFDASKSDVDVPLGKDGQPFFVAGPSDNSAEIVEHLRQRVGEGNFDYLLAWR